MFFYYDAKLKGKIKIENMASPRRLQYFHHLPLKKMHFSQVSNHFSSYSHTPSYLFCSFLIHDGCSFSRTLAGLTIIPFPMSFINQLPIVYCFPVYHSPYILLFSLTHFLLLSVSLHSSEQIVPLQWTVLSTLVHRLSHSSEKSCSLEWNKTDGNRKTQQ